MDKFGPLVWAVGGGYPFFAHLLFNFRRFCISFFTTAMNPFRYKFYLEEQFTETPEVENTSNPEYNYEREITINPVTRALIDYLNSQPLIVEVWGSQTSMKAPGGPGGGGEGSRMVSNATIEKVEAELKMYKSLKDSAELKLQVS